jgi:membrane-associated phospholipid phosphatase
MSTTPEVHHAQDVVAGLALGALAGDAAVWRVQRCGAAPVPVRE